MKFDIRGHDIHLERLEFEIKSELGLLDMLNKKYPGMTPDLYPMHLNAYCHKCGENPSFTKTPEDEDTYTVTTECAYPGEFPPIEVMLEVPSGEILLFNDLSKYYVREESFIDINYMLGIKQYTEHYAKQGMIMHFVGNSCPDVFQISGERLEIGRFPCDKEETCELEDCPGPGCKTVNKIGSICTDLWWYCAVDRDTFEKRIGKTVEQYQEEYHATGAWPEVVRARVTPGTYRTVGQYHIDEDRLFSYIEKVK